MSVKRSRSGSRVLAVLEAIAHYQPVGVTELARRLNDDKSAVQRAIMTLADDGWLRPTTSKPTRWQLSAHILTLAYSAHLSNDLAQRARPVLEALHYESGETVLMNIPDRQRFVVLDVLESAQMLRTTPYPGMEVPVRKSATSRAVLAYLTPAQREEFLGEAPNEEQLQALEETLQRGYAISAGDVFSGTTQIAAPVFDQRGIPEAAIVLSAPSARLNEARHDWAGGLVKQAARKLSRGRPQIAGLTAPAAESAEEAITP
ncbi:IclR family transcriptional regulator [Haliea sp. E17]|uniref:IclR family transcriptional regulator n=1 Tax=Haliea sp. E17 TaxID=3401576 RepID=UPI003AAA9B03